MFPSGSGFYSWAVTEPGSLTLGTHFGVLPTPSPELGHASVHSHVSHHHQDMYIQNQQLPSWEVLRPDAASQVSTGHKRSHDFTVDEFFSDVKKRKVTPAYDPRTFLSLLSLTPILTV